MNKIMTKSEQKSLRKTRRVVRALDHPLRMDILNLLLDHNELKVTDIYVKLRLEQSVASQHLAILRNAEVVKVKRDGKFQNYSVNRDRLDQYKSLFEKFNN